ncbi:MAG: patatin-like phospholipase family protein [Rhodospirillales bacterium]|nr:patatin-like phospholipase family protein [Rhodospirillales bacterium]
MARSAKGLGRNAAKKATARRRAPAAERVDAPAGDDLPPGSVCYVWPRGPGGCEKTINLALQGGGAHGAFTWGVLDRLLEDGRIAVDGISATSAGAINAALLAQGLMAGGPDGARQQLHDFWNAISVASSRMAPLMNWLDVFSQGWNRDLSPGHLAFDLASRVLSPYQLNPFGLNPLRDLLDQTIDVDRIRACETVKLFISATNVETGKIRVFDHKELTVDAILASACLPQIFHAVEIDGQHYWDGGYMGNPALYPLIYNCQAQDVVIIRINPIIRKGVPRTARDIDNRLNEITFNSSLMREMRAIAFVTKLIDERKIDDATMKRMYIHMVEADDLMIRLGVASKLNPDWDFLCHLRDVGRARAERWIASTMDRLGRESTIDIREEFL